MSTSFEISVEISEEYDFTQKSLDERIQKNTWVKDQWPIVYFIQNDSSRPKKIAYIGESTNAYKRIKNHLENPKRLELNKIIIIGSDKFNKSVTLDIESKLIKYLASEENYVLQNIAPGLIKHTYYQQEMYDNLFVEIWRKLAEKKIVTKTMSEIENSELFKYSPYKSLNTDQHNSIIEILKALSKSDSNKIFISGSAGTGKTILAAYLIKLLTTNLDDVESEDLNDEELIEVNFTKEFKNKYPKRKIGLVIAMTSLRKSLQYVFSKTPGLKASMVISPSKTFTHDKYDLLIVDESHRLRQYKNIGWRGAFKKNNQKLGLDDSGNELDWIIANSKNQIFFYDSAQSVKPSDIHSSNFYNLIKAPNTINLELKSQMRVKGGNDYIQFVDELLNLKREKKSKYNDDKYELLFFESFKDFHKKLQKNEDEFKLCRIVAGYSWEWKSDPRKKPPTPDAVDIRIDNFQFQWNNTLEDWVNNPKDPNNPLKEIGCIHTVQGYDLNYTGVIFGNEIDYNSLTNAIEIDSTKYYDKYGKNDTSDEELKSYIINIYKTLMYRGIKGTYVYACNKGLREYLKIYIKEFNE
jgi:DUF2075 family protein/dihydrofolate reductase